MKHSICSFAIIMYFLCSLPFHAQSQPPVWLEIQQGLWGARTVFSRYGVIVSRFDYYGSDRYHLYNTTFYPADSSNNLLIDSLLSFSGAQYQSNEYKAFVSSEIRLPPWYSMIFVHNAPHVTTVYYNYCYDEQTHALIKMSKQILKSLADTNELYGADYYRYLKGEDCLVTQGSPYCRVDTIADSTIRSFFFQMIVDDEVLLTLHDDLGILYQDTQTVFIPRFPDFASRRDYMNWIKLLRMIRKDILQSQSDTIPIDTGDYLLVRVDDQWAYLNHLDRNVIKKWVNKMKSVVPNTCRKSFKRKKAMIIQSWNENVSNI